MNFRTTFSIWLIGVGIILALLPLHSGKTFQLSTSTMLDRSVDQTSILTPDEVARLINAEDSTFLLIDVRNKAEYQNCNLPGSINIPFEDLLNPDWAGYLNRREIKKIFYGNGDVLANIAWSMVTGLGHKNNYVMDGGMNGWYETVMLSRFDGERISARENVIFENRYKARRTFNRINSLPDSLKLKYMQARMVREAQLDGGCD